MLIVSAALLNLHRSYFISALEESPEDLASHSFIPSVLAVYRSAWRLMRSLRYIWGAAPELISKMNVAWSQALSAAVSHSLAHVAPIHVLIELPRL